MKKRRDTTQEERSTIKMPKPPSLIERVQASIEAAGISRDVIKVHEVQTRLDDQGHTLLGIEFSCSLPRDQADKLINRLTIKIFDPKKDTVTIGNAEVKLLSEDEPTKTQPPAKLWTGKERSKRSKPKSDTPDFP